ncbi:UNVERIFIED_CONTAM: hypothetical protein FKN15_036299, partial [Acipenser sinensis]
VPKDPNSQWRKVVWSHDCTLLAYAESTGTVRVFDLMGSELFIIPMAASFPGDLSYSVAGLLILEYTASAQWSAELLVINYRGQLKSYLISVGANQSYQENHSFNFNSHYSHGITTVIYHSSHRLILVGGCESSDNEVSKATRCGLTAWRVLSGFPYYKQVTSYEDDVGSTQRRGLLRMPTFRLFARQGHEQDGVFKMSLSPDGTLLAAIHFSGQLTFWEIPSLKQSGEWSQGAQPGFDEINPEWRNSLEKRKKIKDREALYPLMDVNWWASNAVILARCSGSVTVSSVKTLKNLLGKSCEWFETSPQVTAAHDGGFLSLECEIKLAKKRPRLESSLCEDEDGDEDSDSDDESSAKARYFGYVKQGLYYVTEMERFAPPRKRPRTIIKNYRLIDNEEYGEALSLAQAYGLDSDLVYQRQWRKSTVSIASIQDYLMQPIAGVKEEKVQWAVLMHCCRYRSLLASYVFGLRFIMPGDIDIEEIPYEDLLSPIEELQRKKEGEAKKRQELLKLVDFKKLTLEQKELCRCRLKLLSYLDRLATYEEILGGPHAAEQRYDSEFFKKFRNQNIVLSARTYARQSNVQALDILFTYHGSELLQHRLAILFNFPETTSPHEYAILLPEACELQESSKTPVVGVVVDGQGVEGREQIEESFAQNKGAVLVLEKAREVGEFKLPKGKRKAKIRHSFAAKRSLVSEDGVDQADDSVDCALSLVRLGKERNIPNLELLCDDLVTLETLVYETECDLTVTLKDLQQMKGIDKLRLLMNSSSEEMYVKNAYQWMVPFLHRCESQKPGSANILLKEYLVTLAKEDLKYPLKIFQHSKPDCQQKIIGDHDQLMSIALECIYCCERDNQLSHCYDILECLPQRGYGTSVSCICLNGNVTRTMQTAHVENTCYIKESGCFKEKFHNNNAVHQCNFKNEQVLAVLVIFTESLLCSSRLENIRLAGQMMHCSAVAVDPPVTMAFRGKVQPKVSCERSIELVLAAAREYFNSSTNLMDNCMDLVRCCLQLITDCPAVIQEELDLISALTQLEEFGVRILPLQVSTVQLHISTVLKDDPYCPGSVGLQPV